jgi:deoxyribonucleoside regulator
MGNLLSNTERKQLLEVARWYYEDNLTQAEIAKYIGVSRSTVSRMLSVAKEHGLVRVFIYDAPVDTGETEQALIDLFSLQAVRVVSVTPGDEDLILQATVRESALFATRFISPNDCIGMAWGYTLHELAKNLPKLSLPEVKIVQLLGNIDSATVRSYAMEIINTTSTRLGTTNAYTLPCPIVVDNEIISDILLHDARIRQILYLTSNCNKLFINLALPNEYSCLYQAGYITEKDLSILQEAKSAGSIGCRYIDDMGKMCHPQLNARTIGISLDDILKTETVLACVADSRKAGILHAALVGGYIDVLMVDSITANLVLDIHARAIPDCDLAPQNA